MFVLINGVGHGSIQFLSEDYGDGGIIELQYTGSPKIVLKELQILYQKAKKFKKETDASWLTAEYINLFRKEGDSISIANDNGLWVDFSYRVNCDGAEWNVDYTHHDVRPGMGGILVNFLDGVVLDDKNDFWNECDKVKSFNINEDILTRPDLLEKALLTLKNHLLIFRTIAQILAHPNYKKAYNEIKLMINLLSRN
ncbi:MAG: hypothetical protein GF311_16475 [Candidatus Lokiarchaeota archaeon]|nr:hypothetical protein [Candidatus Lokiarchaeota archaeon]